MQTFIMLTRVSSKAVDRSPRKFEKLEHQAMEKIHKECPQVTWLCSYAVLGPYDYVDIFRAPNVETAQKVSTLIRSFGHAHTEIWAATEWDRFKQMIHTLRVAA